MRMDHLKDVPILVLGNKIDKSSALRESELRDELGLPYHFTWGRDEAHRNPSARYKIEVFMCSVQKRVGYADGFTWLSQFID